MTSVIIDTDVGFDDLLGILYLLNFPDDIDIQAFTVVNGLSSVSNGAQILTLLLAVLDRKIPVFTGLTQTATSPAVPNAFPVEWRLDSHGNDQVRDLQTQDPAIW